jgi:hypothetical protein
MLFSGIEKLIDDYTQGTITINQKQEVHRNAAGNVVKSSSNVVQIAEPIVPNEHQEKYDYIAGGQIQLLDAIWYSRHDEFKVGDEVFDDITNIKYTIANKTNYKHYANVIEYGLKAVTSNSTV